MTEEETRQLKQEIAKLKEEAARKDRRIEELEALLMGAVLRIEELERRLAKDSHNSSKPPSSDGFSHKTKPGSESGKPKGGQKGHPGHTMLQVAVPDQVITHRPSSCEACHNEMHF